MFVIVLLPLLISAVASSPINTDDDATKVNYATAVDISAATSTQTFSCLKAAGYKAVFVRVYTSNGNVDPNGPPNLLNANSGKCELIL